jgi:hypothetical protein
MIGESGGSVAGSVTVDNFPAVQAVSGPLTNAELRLSPVPVSLTGALGSVTVSNFPETQPVSIAGDVPVTGVFFPPTQPVSIASSVAVTGPLTASELISTVVSVVSDNPLEVITISPVDLSASTLAALETVSVTGVATEATLATVASVVKMEDSAHVTGDAGIPMLALRYSTDAPTTSNDGDYTNLKVDEEGRLKVASKPASYVDITGDITAIQATIGTPVAGGTVSGDVSRASNVMMFCTGTFAGVNATFEGSLEATGDANWFGVQAVRSNANTIETATGVLAAQPLYAWELSVNALARVRVRATARTSGTQSWRFKLGTYATEPIPAAQATATQPVSGTVTATVGTSITGGTISPLTVAGVTVEALTAKTATANGTTITNASARGAIFFVNVTAVSGTIPTLAIKMQVQDSLSGLWFDVPGATLATITTAGIFMITISPGLTEAANTKVSFPLPRVYRWTWTIGGTTPSFTFGIGAGYVI